MIKLYVECVTRFQHSAHSFKKKMNEEGFVSAETIGIAVAGVVLVGIIFTIFRGQITEFANNIMNRINGIDDTPDSGL